MNLWEKIVDFFTYDEISFDGDSIDFDEEEPLNLQDETIYDIVSILNKYRHETDIKTRLILIDELKEKIDWLEEYTS